MQKLPEFEEAKSRLSPEQYHLLLRGVELVDILTDAVVADVKRELTWGEGGFAAKIEVAPRLGGYQADLVVLLMDCEVQGFVNGEPVMRIGATYRLYLACKQSLPADFLSIYANTSARNQIWPFFRELAHSMSSRIGIPPLTLPLRIPGVSSARTAGRGAHAVRRSSFAKETGEAR